jgi:hypothetical protein
MDREYIRKHEFIERYLQGQLSGDELEAFEEAYLGDPGLLEELVLTEKLREGLEAADSAPAARRRPGWLSALGSIPYAAAATVLLGLSLTYSGALLVENRGLRDSAPTRLVPLVAVRGDAAPNRIEAPAAGEWIVLMLDAGFTEYDEYRATVAREGAEPVAVREELGRMQTPGYEDQVSLGLPGSLLAPGSYEITLEGRMTDRGAEGYEPIRRTRLEVSPLR